MNHGLVASCSPRHPPLVEIICDGGQDYGYGHLCRSAALAWELKSRNLGVRFRALSPDVAGKHPSVPHDDGDLSLVIIDLPYNGDPWITMARELAVPVLTLDFIGSSTRPDLDISIWDRGSASAGTLQKIGLEFAIIRQEIIQVYPAAQKTGSGVLVIVGGQDIKGLGPVIASRLAEMGQEVTLVEGPLNAVRSSYQDKGYVRLRTPIDLPQRMANCAWAVTNGGATMMEMMFLGKPTWVVPQTDAEAGLANLIAKQGGIFGVGLEGLTVPTLEQCTATAICASRLVDGTGLKRIADEGMALL